MNGTLKEYYKRSLYKGRSQLSRIIDFVFLRLLILASTYIYFLSTVDSKVVILFTFVTTALITIAIELIKSRVFVHHVSKERKKLMNNYRRIKILTMDNRNLVMLCSKAVKSCAYVYVHHKLADLDGDDVINVYKEAASCAISNIHIFSLSGIDKSATKIANSLHDCSLHFHDSAELIDICFNGQADMSDDEIDNLLLKELSKQKKGSILTRVKPFLKSRIISYLTLSVILFVLSFIMDYALYYRIMAMLCLSFAGLSGALSGSRKEKP